MRRLLVTEDSAMLAINILRLISAIYSYGQPPLNSSRSELSGWLESKTYGFEIKEDRTSTAIGWRFDVLTTKSFFTKHTPALFEVLGEMTEGL